MMEMSEIYTVSHVPCHFVSCSGSYSCVMFQSTCYFVDVCEEKGGQGYTD